MQWLESWTTRIPTSLNLGDNFQRVKSNVKVYSQEWMLEAISNGFDDEHGSNLKFTGALA